MNNIQYSPTFHDANDQELTQRIQEYLSESFTISKNENRYTVVTFQNAITIETLKSLDMALMSLGYIRHNE